MSDIPLSALLGALILCLVLSAFFSGSETALMTINRYRLRHLAKQGQHGAIKAQELLARPDRLIGLILLGNNFVNNLAASLATVIALQLWGEGALAITTAVLTLVMLIFSEVAPKTLAALRPDNLAFFASHVYKPLLRLFYPLVWVVNMAANSLLRLLGVSTEHTQGHALSHEELKTVLSEAGAIIPSKDRDMLLRVLDLGNARVEEIMIPRNDLDGIDLEDPLDEIVRQLETSLYTRLPVYEGGIDNIVGIVSLRDALRAMLQGELTKDRLREIAEEPYYIPEGTPLSRQLLNFQHEKRRFGLVVDEYGDLLGLLTLADVLEEIVGEFTTDPSDHASDVQPQPDGTLLVAGSANVRELVRAFQWDLPTDGPRTMNGLILEYLENIPTPGTSLLLNGYPVEILQTQDNAVKMLRIDPKGRRQEAG